MPNTDNIVERVARAIGARHEAVHPEDESHDARMEALARAAIEALREPIQDWLMRNGSTWHNPPSESFVDAMIDGALRND